MFEGIFGLPIFWKAVVLIVIVGAVSFWYSFKTGGRDFFQDLGSRPTDPKPPRVDPKAAERIGSERD